MSIDDVRELHALQNRLERLDWKRSALSSADRARLEQLEAAHDNEERGTQNRRDGAGYL